LYETWETGVFRAIAQGEKRMKTKMIALLMVCTLLAGCANVIPDAPTDEEEPLVSPSEWRTLSGKFTLVEVNVTTNNTNNNGTTTVVELQSTPEIWVDTNTTYGMIELLSFNYTIVHLTFDIINNTVIFNNFTFVLDGYLEQVHDNFNHDFLWSEGYAPEFGNATLHFPEFPFEVTVTYDVVYRVWDGRE